MRESARVPGKWPPQPCLNVSPFSARTRFGRGLAPFRNRRVLVLAVGHMVRDPAAIDDGCKDGYDWAIRSGAELAARIPGQDRDGPFRYRAFGPGA
jgi:hypothetical protein